MAKDQSNEVNQLRRSVSALNDRVFVLENNLKKTQEMMKEDMTRLIDAIRNKK